MFKAIFFDLDGTLADDGDSISEALDQACAVIRRRWPELAAPELAVAYRQVSDSAWGDYDRHLRHLSSPEAMLAAVWNQTLAPRGLCMTLPWNKRRRRHTGTIACVPVRHIQTLCQCYSISPPGSISVC